jgi:ribonuclease HI
VSTEIYTDGGCSGNPGPGGWAWIIIHDGQRWEASGAAPATTNNRMELTAVIEALRGLQRRLQRRLRPGGTAIDVYTDSQYVQLGISRWIQTWIKNGWQTAGKKPVKNRELWQVLHELAGGLQIRWHWLQGHAGHPLNEACDRLVQEAIRSLRT